MKYSFDLTAQPWIPCIMSDGTAVQVGLQEALSRAHEIREILSPSPLVTVSLHRLLLAILHRNFGPSDAQQWRDMWQSGQFAAEPLMQYFDKWRHRFDLFDSERPFYQYPGLPDKMLRPVALLAYELASGNNPTLFDHSLDNHPQALDAGQAACLVVATQSFHLGGLCATEQGNTSATDAPLARGAVVIVAGDSLFETLMLNLVPYNPSYQMPQQFPVSGSDMPAWEQPQASGLQESRPTGYLDYLTWQSRRIWLQPSVAADGSIEVECAVLSLGREFPKDYYPDDTMMAHTVRAKARASENPRPPIRIREDRAIWRDSSALLQSVSGQQQRPANIEHVAEHVGVVLSPHQTRDLWVAGLGSEKAKIHLWRHERQPLPLRYLTDETLMGCLDTALLLAENGGKVLHNALRRLASIICAPDEEREPNRDIVSNMAGAYPAVSLYWSALGSRFGELLLQLPGDDAHQRTTLDGWAWSVPREALDAFDRTSEGLAQNARFLQATVQARRLLAGRLYGQLLPEYGFTKEEVTHA